MNIYFIIIISAILLEFFLSNLSRWLDIKNLNVILPAEFENYYNKKEYVRSQKYFRTNTKFGILTSIFNLILILLVIWFGLFNILDIWVRSFYFSPIINGLIFFASLFIIQDILTTPFSLYSIFIIEEKFGFNKTTPKTYILDKIKSYIIITLLGGSILSLLLLFFEKFPQYGWLYAWAIISLFIILIQPLFTTFIAPIFNNFKPLEDGSLKTKINSFAEKTNFPLEKIDVMDGSLRSSKANAYFSGIGKNKRIALFDTLIEKHTDDELVSIIAHEIGHYKCKHNIKTMIWAIVQSGLMFFILSLFINNSDLFSVFGMQNLSIYASIIFFSLLYSPIDLFMSFISNLLSRKHEFEADAFAKHHIGTANDLIKGLKKLTVSNLGNLNPHPLTVWLSYSHPPILKRIQKLTQN